MGRSNRHATRRSPTAGLRTIPDQEDIDSATVPIINIMADTNTMNGIPMRRLGDDHHGDAAARNTRGIHGSSTNPLSSALARFQTMPRSKKRRVVIVGAGITILIITVVSLLAASGSSGSSSSPAGAGALDPKSPSFNPTESTVASLLSSANVPDPSRVWDKYLPPLLVERLPGTPSHAKAKDHIINSLKELGWTIDLDSFEDSTPMGNMPFTNIVATRHPSARKRLVLAAHYDSKWFENGAFIGAIDSAAPCAILLELAATLKPALDAIRTPPDTSLQLIFFDGEEAWVEWSETDSLYGSRHLAAKWERERLASNPESTVLQSISAFVLLDLLGAPQTTVYNLQRSTASHFARLAHWDEQLRMARFNLFRIGSSASTNSVNRYFHPEVEKQPFINFQIEDDHIPFMRRGVPIVHLIPAQFPHVWHTLADDRSALDKDTIINLARIVTAYCVDTLQLRWSA